MSELTRTGAFVAAAAVSLILAGLFAPVTELRPKELAAANLGEEFYPGFTNPNEATGVRVVTFNEAQAAARPFSVEFKNGKWTIPSHHNYPADGTDRLARTAASAIGVKREELRSTLADDHAELGVIDPLEQDATKLKGRGQRVTFSKGDTVAFDLIIGKQVKNRAGYYYVRKPDENRVYVSKLDIDVSTKFADWVETDLLKLERDELRYLVMNNYSIDEAQSQIVQGDIVELTRDKSADQWGVKDLKGDAEEVQTARINDLVNTLDDLRLTGIRPKPAGLRDDLKLDQGISLDRLTQLDLQQRGYFVYKGDLISNEGQFEAATDKGVVYTLRFGEIFAGDDLELEAGIKTGSKDGDAKAGDKSADPAKTEGEKKDTEKKDGAAEEKPLPEGPKANRYLFVTAHFDAKYLGPKPVKPEPPAPKADAPAEPKPDAAPAEAPKSDAPKPESPKPDEAKPEPKPEEPKKEEAPKEEAPKQEARLDRDDRLLASADASQVLLAQADAAKAVDEERPEPLAKPKADPKAKPDAPADDKATRPAPKTPEEAAYYGALDKYESDLKEYEDKVKKGQEKVAQLNKRFADWYYVISAESYNKLHVSRKDVVKEKTPVVDPTKPAVTPDASSPAAPKTDADQPGDAKPAAEKPEAPKAEPKPEAAKNDPAKPSDAKPEEPGKEEPKKAEPPQEEAKPAEPKPSEPKPESPKEEPKAEAAKDETKPE